VLGHGWPKNESSAICNFYYIKSNIRVYRTFDPTSIYHQIEETVLPKCLLINKKPKPELELFLGEARALPNKHLLRRLIRLQK
jgi:hypothetical protein